MRSSSFFRAGLVGLAIVVQPVLPAGAQDVLTISRGTASSSIKVSVNRAVVMESATSFAQLSVANPAIADISTLSDKSIYILGKSPGRTTLTLLDNAGRLITNVDVQVSPDIAEFKERLHEILPGEKIDVRTANDGIVLSGRVSGTRKVALAVELGERYAPGKVTNLMTVGGTQQVMLKVRFAEMQRSVSKSLSSSLGLSTSVAGTTGLQGGTGSYTGSFNPTVLTDGIPTTGPVVKTTTLGSLGIGFSAGGIQMALLLEALEKKGLVRTLAEPNLVTISGQSAKFLAGGEYPIPISDGQTTTIEYKPFGVELNFKPVVVDDNLINLTISAAVSSIDTTVTVTQNGGISVNAFKRRETSTVVEMRDGQSFAIAGLLQDDFTGLANQVPWLGDVPVLGALFRSSDFNRRQSELVIIVTPHLVTPVKSDALALPTDRVRIPTESELFLMGKTAGKARKKGHTSVSTQDIKAPYGYVME
ncbi:MAG: type II and III secretion system protein family protein [Paracoccaceae bacterium]|nr:type II and III secretion system protein family protein [Paracoccaceae bacterium]